MVYLYSLAINLYVVFIKLASLFNNKAKQWCHGRKNLFKVLQTAFPRPVENLFWFHASSLGEFEQARPVMELLKKERPEVKIALTFFSPSGYEIRKNYSGADYIFYLPPDTQSNAQQFLNILKPKAAVFVKYDFWFNYINELNRQQIPLVYFSVLLRPGHFLTKSYSSWFLNSLRSVKHFFVQDEFTLRFLKNRGFAPVELSGDTRYDRVIEIANTRKDILQIEEFASHRRLIIAGSTWKTDDLILSSASKSILDKQVKFIIAPHHVDERRLREIEGIYHHLNPVRYSKMKAVDSSRCLIIDNIGMLSSLYFYANITYVGGGFNKTVHNTQEPAVYGKPVIFGPNFHTFKEAVQLVENGGGFTIDNPQSLSMLIDKLIADPEFYLSNSIKAAELIRSSGGNTKKIVDFLKLL
jgi:3-deoxy-D-manno-octulosonic-acid transferase